MLALICIGIAITKIRFRYPKNAGTFVYVCMVLEMCLNVNAWISFVNVCVCFALISFQLKHGQKNRTEKIEQIKSEEERREKKPPPPPPSEVAEAGATNQLSWIINFMKIININANNKARKWNSVPFKIVHNLNVTYQNITNKKNWKW